MRPYTLRLEDPADDPAQLVENLGTLEALGYRVECPALAGQMRRRRRDEYLRQALALMDSNKTTWGQCVQLAAGIGGFEARWGRWRDCETVPETFGALGRCLFQARKCGPLPTTPEQLRNIIAKFNGRCNLVEKPFPSAVDPE